MNTSLLGCVPPGDASLQIVTKILVEQCECTVNITKNTRLVEDLELESIALLTLITELENHYQEVFEINEESEMATVGDIVQYIEDRINKHD